MILKQALDNIQIRGSWCSSLYKKKDNFLTVKALSYDNFNKNSYRHGGKGNNSYSKNQYNKKLIKFNLNSSFKIARLSYKNMLWIGGISFCYTLK